MTVYRALGFLLTGVISTIVAQEQVIIQRIEAMPNQPSPYVMRDWRSTALGYDSLVFDLNARGEYLPLVWINTHTVNYPQHESFGLATVVGTTRPFSAEAINLLPAVIGATLVGVDKSRQNGRNWVLMCEEFFNNRPEEFIYLNHPTAQSGDDWWYETMPNVFFYQLYDLYPGTGDFDRQFRLVAEQWLRAVKAMGGNEAPWSPADMQARAWSFSAMKAMTAGVPEPEAAGAIAWILYNAYCRTGDDRYRLGAEWAMEFLNAYPNNPAYELQLPYGVYIAARMNAELGTLYNVDRMLNWCFDRSPLRNWGAILGNWGGYDVHGLIGELSGNDYAFLMNGFQQAGALVPMVRYDERFARAVAKWVLNLANASRLFYSPFLPESRQDSRSWSSRYDPKGYIGYEALRKEAYGLSPFATGDAVRGGWGRTNLALYASSHVGYLGSIVDTTNVPMILKLDLLKTDFFRRPAFPTFLLYNPYGEEKTVMLQTPAVSSRCDIYDAVGNRFLLRNAQGRIGLRIPGDGVIMPVVIPADGIVTYAEDLMLVNEVVVDFHTGRFSGNYPPRIKAIAAQPNPAHLTQSVRLYCEAEDRESAVLRYAWYNESGAKIADEKTAEWRPMAAGEYAFRCVVEDGAGGSAERSVTVQVMDNRPPVIASLRAEPDIVDPDGTLLLTCSALDPDGDSLYFYWQAESGNLRPMTDRAEWRAPKQVGAYRICCTVRDARGAESQDSLLVVVGRLVGEYSLDGHAWDSSGFANHGRLQGPLPAPDRQGNEGKALRFDGVNDAVAISNHLTLNSRNIALSFWLNWDGRADREEYVISHGSWNHRLKASILTDGRLRWTVKTDAGVADLDSQTRLVPGIWYHLCIQYDGNFVQIWLNGRLDAQKSWSGPLGAAGMDLLLGQSLPGEISYNFKGLLDELCIYNRPLTEEEISGLMRRPASINGKTYARLGDRPYPNPFNTCIIIPLPAEQEVKVEIHDLLGRQVRRYEPHSLRGRREIEWDGRDDTGCLLSSGCYVIIVRCAGRSTVWKIAFMK
ncbi:MAG: laminin G [candidate division KSB1 bacterium]|nr:laminin G [candidate division KSB1 bacterium]